MGIEENSEFSGTFLNPNTLSLSIKVAGHLKDSIIFSENYSQSVKLIHYKHKSIDNEGFYYPLYNENADLLKLTKILLQSQNQIINGEEYIRTPCKIYGNYVEDTIEYKEIDFPNDIIIETRIDFINNSNNILSYQILIDQYSNGMGHPSHSVYTHNIDLITTTEIEYEDIFINNYNDKLDTIIKNGLMIEFKCANEKELDNIFWKGYEVSYPTEKSGKLFSL